MLTKRVEIRYVFRQCPFDFKINEGELFVCFIFGIRVDSVAFNEVDTGLFY
jgi:hypothetical protein